MARATRINKFRLGELLLAEGLLTEDQVEAGLSEQRRSNLFLGEALVKLGYVSEETIAQAIIQQFNLPFLSASQYNITPEVFGIFPERMYYEYQFLALDRIANTLLVVGAGLMNNDVLEELERISGCKVCQYVGTWRDIQAIIYKNTKDAGLKQELTGLGAMLMENTAPLGSPPPGIEQPEPARKGGTSLKKSSTARVDYSAKGAGTSGPRPSVIKPGSSGLMTSVKVPLPGKSAMIPPRSAAPMLKQSLTSALKGAMPPTAMIPSARPQNVQAPRLSALLPRSGSASQSGPQESVKDNGKPPQKKH